MIECDFFDRYWYGNDMVLIMENLCKKFYKQAVIGGHILEQLVYVYGSSPILHHLPHTN